MKTTLLLCFICSLVGVGFSLRATILRCLKIVPSWSEIDCSPYQEQIFAELDEVYAGNYLEKYEEWLDNPIPPEWTYEELADYCVYRECRSNQAMVDYMNIYGYVPYCMEQSVEEWLNDRFYARCTVRVNRTLELRPVDYATYYCYKVYRTQDPDIPCPTFPEIQDPNRPTVQQRLKDKEVIADNHIPGSDQWWVAQMRDISLNSNGAFHYGWIINTNTLKNQVALWSPYQGPTIPVSRDIAKIIPAVNNKGGNIMLGDIRKFACAQDGSADGLICPEYGDVLAFDPLETIIMVPTDSLIVMGMTQSEAGIPDLKSALYQQAAVLKDLGY
uniref:Luciferase 2 n=1 Tax=Odontosyllis octodentata TaxID=2336528 RepID=A0A5A4PWC1_9ANNE|nr:luciferase 2 [Odontosyllis octodentata]